MDETTNKNPKNAGRPLKFANAKELQKKIDKYFDSCFRPLTNTKTNEIIKDVNGNEILAQFKPFTIAGLAYSLGTNRMTLLNYQNREESFEIISRAKERCEAFTEESLFDRDKWNGAKFALLNGYGWEDKTTNKIEGIDEILSKRRKKDADKRGSS
jgi:hypothetical protein